MKPRVPFLAPAFPDPDSVAAAYAAIVASGQFSNGGAEERAFAAEVAVHIGPGVSASILCSATAALQLACKATFRQRPLAIVPSFTFAAGPLALRWCGHRPVFCDVESTGWQPDPRSAALFLEEHADQVGGILLTQTFGVGSAAVADWETLAAMYGLPLVIDSAAGFGSHYPDGTRLGARGTCEVFSFHATKLLAIGEGGAVTSIDADLVARIDRLKNFGFGAERAAEMLGTNAKLPELSAAIGRLQLERLPDRLRARREIVRRYMATLGPLGMEFQPGVERSAPAFVTAALPTTTARDAFLEALSAIGVECRAYYNPPVHRHPYFDADTIVCSELTNTEALSARVISLPIADDLPSEVVDEIANTLVTVLSAV